MVYAAMSSPRTFTLTGLSARISGFASTALRIAAPIDLLRRSLIEAVSSVFSPSSSRTALA
jgi:hypothetical protein